LSVQNVRKNNPTLFEIAPPACPPLSLDEKIARIRLYRAQNVGPITYRNLMTRYQTALKALDALPDLAARGGFKGNFKLPPETTILKELEAHDKIGAQLIVEGEEDFPPAFQELSDAPPVLSLRGNTELLRKKTIGIVGARNCSLNGRKIALQLAQDLGKSYVIASGLARGIDSQAHQGALETGTIAVIAGGIDQIYPSENEVLFHKITEHGLILSDAVIGTEPHYTLFPKRNRLIAALSCAVIVIEAAEQSGSLITARYAVEQNREVFVVPGSPLDPRYHGSNRLIRTGATLITEAQDVLDALENPYHQALQDAAVLKSKAPLEIATTSDMQELAEKIMEYLSPSPISLDELLRACSYSSAVVLSALLELELAGKVTRHPGNMIST
jgi:DNA processing protein